MRIFKYKKTLALLVLIAVGAGGWFYWRSASSSTVAPREATVKRGDIQVAVLATAVVQPRNRLEIKPPIAGRLDDVLVAEGQRVARGQLLAWMSSSERAALLDAARSRGADELKRWEELYRPTPIYAPVAGTVIDRRFEPGQTVTNQDAVLVMSDRLTVVAQVDETDISKIRLRQPASVTFDAYPDTVVPGSVEQIAFDAKTVNNVITYEINVLPEKPPAFMRSGMTANVSFIVAEKNEVLWLPTEAVQRKRSRSSVQLPSEDRRSVTEKSVELGVSDGRRIEIVSGLSEGDTVIIPQLTKPSEGRSQRSNPLTPGGGGRR